MSARPRITRVAAYGLVLDGERMLLCRISPHLPHDAGAWTLPGGGLDFGEDPVDAVVREVREETGLRVRPLAPVAIDSIRIEEAERELHGLRIIYRTEVIGGTLAFEQGGSTDMCAWWSQREARRLPLVDLARVGLELAFSHR